MSAHVYNRLLGVEQDVPMSEYYAMRKTRYVLIHWVLVVAA